MKKDQTTITGLWTCSHFKSEVRSRKSEWGYKWVLNAYFSDFRLPISAFDAERPKSIKNLGLYRVMDEDVILTPIVYWEEIEQKGMVH